MGDSRAAVMAGLLQRLLFGSEGRLAWVISVARNIRPWLSKVAVNGNFGCLETRTRSAFKELGDLVSDSELREVPEFPYGERAG